MARQKVQRPTNMNSAHLREQVDQHLKTLCHRRLAKLDWKLSELAQHVYDTATPTESEVSMLRAILQREVAILGKKGIQIMVALGAKDLQLVWKDWPEVGTLTPSKIPDNPRASSITKVLGEQARNRIQILGFTQEHFAAKVSGAYEKGCGWKAHGFIRVECQSFPPSAASSSAAHFS